MSLLAILGVLPQNHDFHFTVIKDFIVSDKFMTNEIAEYEIGKRHLANIMGEDPDTFRQEDIDVRMMQ